MTQSLGSLLPLRFATGNALASNPLVCTADATYARNLRQVALNRTLEILPARALDSVERTLRPGIHRVRRRRVLLRMQHHARATRRRGWRNDPLRREIRSVAGCSRRRGAAATAAHRHFVGGRGDQMIAAHAMANVALRLELLVVFLVISRPLVAVLLLIIAPLLRRL